MASRSAVSFGLLALAATAVASAQSLPHLPNAPPRIEISAPSRIHSLQPCRPERITLRLVDPDGDPVHFAGVDGGPECLSPPLRGQPSGTVVQFEVVEELLREGASGRLLFECWDDAHADQPTRRSLRLGRRVEEETWFGLAAFDGDRDGDREIVASSFGAYYGGVQSAGVLAVFDPFGGRTRSRPPAELLVPQIPQSLEIDSVSCSSDLDGDAVVDLVSTYHRAVQVWFGRAPGPADRLPDALLAPSDPNPPTTTTIRPLPLLRDDFDGDGIEDLLVGFDWVDTSVADAGEVLLFKGGAALAGAPTPVATLRVPSPSFRDWLAGGTLGHADPMIQRADVTGDGVLDLLVSAPYADLTAPFADDGAIYLWDGATLSGSPAPLARLQKITTPRSSTLGFSSQSRSIVVADVTGDGIDDVLAATGLKSAGKVVAVWPGGAALSGNVEPAALLASPLSGGDYAASQYATEAIQCADVTLDGIDDVIVLHASAKIGTKSNAGAVLVFAGGALAGSPAPAAILQLAAPSADDRLGSARFGIRIADVTGDGHADVLAATSKADVTSISPSVDNGAIAVFEARATLSGTVTPSSLLVDPTGEGRELTETIDFGMGWRLEDLTGDGILDVMAVSPKGWVGGVGSIGSIYAWHGGPALAGGGTVAPDATLRDALAGSWRCGQRDGHGTALHFIDWDGDGSRDVATWAEVFTSSSVKSGRVLVWLASGGWSGLRGSDVDLVTSVANDSVGALGTSVWFHDLDGDGSVDVVAGAPQDDLATGADAGSLSVWFGGAGKTGQRLPDVVLTDPLGAAGDQLGANAPRFLDVDGSGRDGIVAPVPLADLGYVNCGLLLWFDPTAAAAPTPRSWMGEPRLRVNAELGKH